MVAGEITDTWDRPLVCIGCGYDLRAADPRGRCPECGLRVAESAAAGQLPDAAWRARVGFACGVLGVGLMGVVGLPLLVATVGVLAAVVGSPPPGLSGLPGLRTLERVGSSLAGVGVVVLLPAATAFCRPLRAAPARAVPLLVRLLVDFVLVALAVVHVLWGYVSIFDPDVHMPRAAWIMWVGVAAMFGWLFMGPAFRWGRVTLALILGVALIGVAVLAAVPTHHRAEQGTWASMLLMCCGPVWLLLLPMLAKHGQRVAVVLGARQLAVGMLLLGRMWLALLGLGGLAGAAAVSGLVVEELVVGLVAVAVVVGLGLLLWTGVTMHLLGGRLREAGGGEPASVG